MHIPIYLRTDVIKQYNQRTNYCYLENSPKRVLYDWKRSTYRMSRYCAFL